MNLDPVVHGAGPFVISAQGLGKWYRLGAGPQLGVVGRAWATLRGRDPWAVEAERGFWALREVSFDVARGEAFGVIGRNGAGKSTLFKLLSRITPPSEGRAEVRGRLASLLEVGVGFQPELSGRDNIYLSGALLGMKAPEIRACFDAIVDFAELSRFIDTPIKRYSSGMYMRLAFAVVAFLRADILLVDEVLAVGDVTFQRRCVEKMAELTREGRTVLFISHDLGSVRRLCSRALWLEAGTVAGMGRADEMVAAYLDRHRLRALSWSRTADYRPALPGRAAYDGAALAADAEADTAGPPATLLEVALVDDGGRLLTEVTTASALRVRVRFRVETSRDDVVLSLELRDASDTAIATVYLHDEGAIFPRAPGEYVAQWTPPADLWLPRQYSLLTQLVTLGTADDWRVWDAAPPLVFTPAPVDSFATATAWRPGVVALRGQWTLVRG